MIIDKKAVLEGAKEVFFKAHLAGYAGDGKDSVKTKSADGKVTIEFIEGDYRVLDEYYTTPHSDHSFGTTIIFYKGAPVWMMHYRGYYRKKVIPFLKEALGKAYAANAFFGGRGIRTYVVERLHYQNFPMGSWSDFKGMEEIRIYETREQLGYHDYGGMSLI